MPPVPDGGWCEQPGAWVHDTDAGYHLVTGFNVAGSDLSWVRMPPGFCVRYFGTVPNARSMRFAPGGELFVSSPTQGTTGGGINGLAAIAFLTDDDGDGLADGVRTWRAGLGSTQGMLFYNGGFYYQDSTSILREPYAPGDRTPSGSTMQLADITYYSSSLHWPKTLDVAEDGTIYVTNGGDQGEDCDPSRPFRGGILKLDSSVDGGVTGIAKGLRNAIYLRCHHDGNNHCFANELSLDYSTDMQGREKLIPVRAGDDWGFPLLCDHEHAIQPDLPRVLPTTD